MDMEKIYCSFKSLNLEKEEREVPLRILVAGYNSNSSISEWNATIKNLTQRMIKENYYLQDVKEMENFEVDKIALLKNENKEKNDYFFLMFFEKMEVIE